jgi:hypothetical protein
MPNDQIVDIASRVGGVEGKLGALVETFADHRAENHRDHKAVMDILVRMEGKLDLKADKQTVDGMQKDHDINTIFRKVAVWAGAAWVLAFVGSVVAKAAGL